MHVYIGWRLLESFCVGLTIDFSFRICEICTFVYVIYTEKLSSINARLNDVSRRKGSSRTKSRFKKPIFLRSIPLESSPRLNKRVQKKDWKQFHYSTFNNHHSLSIYIHINYNNHLNQKKESLPFHVYTNIYAKLSRPNTAPSRTLHAVYSISNRG